MNKSNSSACNKFKTKSFGTANASELSKNAEIERRRKLRLEQVRQRSKDFAANIRKKVHDEKNRQLHQYNATKSSELSNWKRNQLKETQKLYERNLSKIGEAHLAAKQENIVIAKICEKNRQNSQIAKNRGIVAMAKIRKKAVVADNAAKMELMQKRNNAKRENIFVKTTCQRDDPDPLPDKCEKQHDADTNLNRLSESIVEIVDISTDDADDSLSSSLEIQSLANKLSKTLPLVYTNDPNKYLLNDDDNNANLAPSSFVPTSSNAYNPQEFTGNDSTGDQHNNEKPFTQISQFLSNRRKASTIDTRTIDSSIPQFVRGVRSPKKNVSPTKSSKEYIPQFSKKLSKFISTNIPSSSGNILRPPEQLSSSTSYIPKVKFYDHANRFTKEYHPKSNIIQRIECNADVATAVDAAVAEQQFDDLKLEYLNELKKKADIRSKEAMEKEKIRKDYEKMLTQLEELTKQQNYAQMYTNPHPSYEMQSRKNQDLQEKLNERMEQEFVHRPIPITCPRKTTSTTETDNANTAYTNLADNDNGALFTSAFPQNQLNSSDSTNSILLNRLSDEEVQKLLSKVTQQKLQLQNDGILKSIENIAVKSNDENHVASSSSSQTINKSKENSQQKEQQRNKTINELTKEKEKLEEFAKQMKAKEKSLERKAKKLFLAEMERKKHAAAADKCNQTKPIRIQNVEIQTDDRQEPICSNNETTSSTNESTLTTTSSMSSTLKSPPVKIIIKVNNDCRAVKKYRKSPRKSPRKRPVHVQVKSNKDLSKVADDSGGKIYPKTPIKQSLKSVEIQTEQQLLHKPDAFDNGSITSTIYRTLPPTIDTELNKVVVATANQPITQAQHNKSNENNKKKLIVPEPMLRHYITRLLGMSRTSIEQLGHITATSSTSIETPSDSIINVTSNQSTIEQSNKNEEQTEHLIKLQKFIDDNHNLLNEMEDTLQNVQKATTTKKKETDSATALSKIWIETFKQNSKHKNVPKKSIKPILKNVEEQSTIQKEQSKTNVDAADDDDDEKLTNLYAQLTENCNQRFAELNEKINKVRREKQKLLEEATIPTASKQQPKYSSSRQRQSNQISQSISSSSDRDMPSSEYCSFKMKALMESYDSCSQAAAAVGVVGQKNQQQLLVDEDDDDDSRHMRLISGTKKNNIALSRDSGICTSRPVTSSDIRDSPDIRTIKFDQQTQSLANDFKQIDANEQQMNKNENKNAAINFEPLLKDIPKYFIDEMVGTDNLAEEAGSKITGQKRIGKPPTALKRYSPHLEELPHELSTIIEIDTPATSQLNTSINDTLAHSALAKLVLKKFVTFHEYAREHGLDLSKFDPNEPSLLSNVDEIDLKRILDWTAIHPDLMHKLFASPMPSLNDVIPSDTDDHHQQSINVDDRVTAGKSSSSNVAELLKYRKFPTLDEYAQKMTKLYDNENTDLPAESAEVIVPNPTKSNCEGDSGDSFPDMELEAKKRNLIFGQTKAIDNNWDEFLPTDNDDRKQQNQVVTKASSSSDTFEEELNKMKMNWAGSIIRKTKKLHAMTSSSSSSIENPPVKSGVQQVPATKNSFIDSNITNNSATISLSSTTVESPESNKKPMNLKEFFAKELLRRTQSLSSTSSSSSPLLDDSTLSSNFLRSLLGTSSGGSRSSQSNGKHINVGATTTGLTDKHTTTQRTSTPVKLISTDSTSLSNGGATGTVDAPATIYPQHTHDDGNLFSAESRLSSVKNNSTSTTNSSTNTNDAGQPKPTKMT